MLAPEKQPLQTSTGLFTIGDGHSYRLVVPLKYSPALKLYPIAIAVGLLLLKALWVNATVPVLSKMHERRLKKYPAIGYSVEY